MDKTQTYAEIKMLEILKAISSSLEYKISGTGGIDLSAMRRDVDEVIFKYENGDYA